MTSLIHRIRRRFRIQKIKRAARQPRVYSASMEDVQAKLRDYTPRQTSHYDPGMIINYHND